jgi:acyl dehydratase
MREIASLAELKKLVGQEVAVSDWIAISQERIDLFAQATGDYQWIHTDVERSRKESPFGGTVAHGFLTLSLLPVLMEKAVAFPVGRMSVNYGLNRVRFPAPVPVGSRLRGRWMLRSVEDISGGTQTTWQATVEREGSDKPVCVAEFIARHYV